MRVHAHCVITTPFTRRSLLAHHLSDVIHKGAKTNILLSKTALVRAQKSYKKDRDLSILVTVGLYVLQVLEASTNAHLLQHNVDDNLTLSPQIIKDVTSNRSVMVASLNFKF